MRSHAIKPNHGVLPVRHPVSRRARRAPLPVAGAQELLRRVPTMRSTDRIDYVSGHGVIDQGTELVAVVHRC